MNRFQLVNNSRFISCKKNQAQYFLDTFKFAEEMEIKLMIIAKSGFILVDGGIETIFPMGLLKSQLSFGNL